MAEELIPEIKVKVNGSPLADEDLDDVLSVSINEKVNALTVLTLKVMVSWDKTRSKLVWVDEPKIKEGDEVTVSLGYLGAVKDLFIGEITGMSFEMDVEGVPTVTLNGYDLRHRLKRSNVPDSYKDKTYDSIVKAITGKVGLTATVEGSKSSRKYERVRMDSTANELSYLETITKKIGYDITVQGKKIFLRSQGDALKKSAVVTLNFEADLSSFSVQVSSMELVQSVSIKSYNIDSKEGTVAKITSASKDLGTNAGYKKAISNFGDSQDVDTAEPFPNKIELEDAAQAKFDEMSLSYIQVSVSCQGRTDLKAGDIVKVEGVGKKFSGLYYMDSVTHSYNPGSGYQTNFSGRSNATNG
jgi:phage protein D